MQAFNNELYQLPMRFSPSISPFTTDQKKTNKAKPSPILSLMTHDESYYIDQDEIKAKRLFENFINDNREDIEATPRKYEWSGQGLVLDFKQEPTILFGGSLKEKEDKDIKSEFIEILPLGCEIGGSFSKNDRKEIEQQIDSVTEVNIIKPKDNEINLKIDTGKATPPRKKRNIERLLDSGCNCKKNKCSKLNCICYSSNQKCRPDCKCDNCFNSKVLLTKRIHPSVITVLQNSDVKHSFLLKRLNIF